MIKNGKFCIFNNHEYKMNEDMNGNTIILTKDINKTNETFVDKYSSGVYSKIVTEEELSSIYSVHTYGLVSGVKVNVEKEQEDYYLVGTADCKIAEQLGLERCDKYYYEGKIKKIEVQISVEKIVKK